MRKTIFASALAAVALLGCTKTDPETENPDRPVAIRFGQSIDAFSKAPVAGDKLTGTNFSLYAVEYDATPAWAAANFMDGETIAVAADGALSYTNTRYYTIGKKYDFYACYPALGTEGIQIAAAEAGKAPVVTFDCKDNQPDLMIANATGKTKSNDAIPFAFSHQLAQVIVKVQSESQYTPAAVVSAAAITAQYGGTMDLASGDITLDVTTAPVNVPKVTNAGDVTVTTTPQQLGDALMLPVQTGISTMTLTVNSVTSDPIAISGLVLKKGKTTTITLTLKGMSISFSQTVTPWATGGTDGSGDVNI